MRRLSLAIFHAATGGALLGESPGAPDEAARVRGRRGYTTAALYRAPEVRRQNVFAVHVFLESPPGLLQGGLVSRLAQLAENQAPQQRVQVACEGQHNALGLDETPFEGSASSRKQKGGGAQLPKYTQTQDIQISQDLSS